MSLQDWVQYGWLTEHKSSREEIKNPRKKRNLSSYEMGGTVSDGEAKEMATLARELRAEVDQWIRAEHPELL